MSEAARSVSVVAATIYILAIIGHLARGAPDEAPAKIGSLDKSLLLLLLALLLLLLLTLALLLSVLVEVVLCNHCDREQTN